GGLAGSVGSSWAQLRPSGVWKTGSLTLRSAVPEHRVGITSRTVLMREDTVGSRPVDGCRSLPDRPIQPGIAPDPGRTPPGRRPGPRPDPAPDPAPTPPRTPP